MSSPDKQKTQTADRPQTTGHNDRFFIQRLVGKPIFWIIFVGIFFTGPLIWGLNRPAPKEILVFGKIEPFQLRNQFNQKMGSRQLMGRVWLASTICTECSIQSTNVMEALKEVQHRARNLGNFFKIVSFSSDPAKDTPKQLRSFIKGKRISPRMWIFMTSYGSPDVIRRTVHDLFYPEGYVDETSDQIGTLVDPITSNTVVLVDGMLQIRGRYDIRDEGAVNQLLLDAGMLVNRPDYFYNPPTAPVDSGP